MPEVPGFGPRNAKIMLVGEAPAKTEVALGKPFMGKAGDVLNTILMAANIPRDSVYITNASLSPVTGDKKEFFFVGGGKSTTPTPTFINGIGRLVKDIQEIKPNVVIALGNYALWALMQHQSVMNWRGSVLWSKLAGVKVVPTLHPAALLRGSDDSGATTAKEGGVGGMWKYLSAVVYDFNKAKRQSRSPEYKLRPRNVLFNPVGPEMERAVSRLLSASRIHFDMETFGGTNLAMAGFSDEDPEWAVVFLAQTIHLEGQIFPGQLGVIKHILESDIPKAGHNICGYDVPMLDSVGIHTKNVWWDTMISQHVLVPELPKKLAFLTSLYTDIPFYKEEGKIIGAIHSVKDLKQGVFYCGKDVCSTCETRPIHEANLIDRHLLDYFFQRRMAIFPPLRDAMAEGFRADLAELWRLAKETDDNLTKAQAELNQIAGREINVNSGPQVQKLLYTDRKIKARTKKGRPTADAHVLADIAARTGDPVPRLITKVRRLRKLLSSYYSSKILDANGRIYTTFNIAGIRNGGRVSSGDPLWRPGVAVQTIPAKRGPARGIFIADDGTEILECDGAQAEAVVTAYLANDPIHMDCFRTGKDVHRVTAALLNGMPPSDWERIPKPSEIREIAKTCNHELNYGAGWFMFMLTVNEEWDPDDPHSVKLDRDLAQVLHGRYHAIRPALGGYWETIRRELKDNGMRLDAPLGWHRYFLDQWSSTMLNAAYSFKPQNTVGEATNIGILQVLGYLPPPFDEPDLVDVQHQVKERGVKLLAQVHDSATFKVPKGEDDLCRGIMRLMEVPLYVNGYRIVIPIEGKVGPTWLKKTMRDLGVTRKTVEL